MSDKLLIAGLGNPGTKYSKTRHNIGFRILEALADTWNVSPASDSVSMHGDTLQKGRKIILLQPMEYMNLSGGAVLKYAQKEKVAVENILVLHDEIDLPFGTIRMKVGGGHAGHNGLRNIIDRIGTRDFCRLRFGVGRPTGPMDVADYVLGKFSPEEEKKIPNLMQQSLQKIEDWVRERAE